MRPDLRKPIRAGWATLAGAVVLVVMVLAILGGDDVGAQLDKAKHEYGEKQGRQDFAHLLRAQREANAELGRTIGQLKRDTGMSRNPYFIVPPDTQQKGRLWRERFIWVQDQLRKRAKDRSVLINEDLGFGQYAEGVAPEDLADSLLTALQLVQKATTIALSTTDTNFARITVKPELKPLLAGSKERPLLREFPVTLTVVGSDKDILWVLHRFSLVEPQTAATQQTMDAAAEAADDKAIAALFPKLSRPSGMHDLTPDETRTLDEYVVKRDYPLVVQSLVIDGDNTTERDQFQQLTATFVVVGMRFLADDERGGAPAARPHPPRPTPAEPQPAAAARAATPAAGRAPTRSPSAFKAQP